jgi:hypothetical protein
LNKLRVSSIVLRAEFIRDNEKWVLDGVVSCRQVSSQPVVNFWILCSVDGLQALRIFLSIYPILKCELLSVGAELIIYKALIKSVLTYACPALEFAADSHLLKLQRLQNIILHATGNLPRHNPIRDLHRPFKIPYLHEYGTQLCREQANVICNHDNINIRTIGQGETSENMND